MVYRYRLAPPPALGEAKRRGRGLPLHNWKNTNARRVEYEKLPRGNYTFEALAVDRDGVYSEKPAIARLNVVSPWYLSGWIAIPLGGVILALFISSIVFGSRYYVQRRKTQRLQARMLEQERLKNAQLQEAKEAAEAANQAKSRLLANMSHEIRTPLNAILGYAQILQRDEDSPPPQRDAVRIIEKSGKHLLGLINDVLDISKIESGRLELHRTDFDLRGLIEELSVMFQLRCAQKQLSWRVEWTNEQREGKEERDGWKEGTDVNHVSRFTFHDSRLWVRGDEGKLRQVLINLLSNAVKFTEKGEVMLRISESANEQMPPHPPSLTPHRIQSAIRNPQSKCVLRLRSSIQESVLRLLIGPPFLSRFNGAKLIRQKREQDSD